MLMVSTSETGHARNVAHFLLLTEQVALFGPAYNPPSAAITLTALRTRHAEAVVALEARRVAGVAHDEAANAREIAFARLTPLAGRVVNSLRATDSTPQTLADAASALRILRGGRASKRVVEEQTDNNVNPVLPRSISASRRSYDQMAENFARLVEIVRLDPHYSPNEAELGLAALDAYRGILAAANARMAAQNAALMAALATRDRALYGPHDGLPVLAAHVKSYVKSLFGVSSSQYKAISGIRIQHSR